MNEIVIHPFQSRSEVEEYLSHDKISCLICGIKFKLLGPHLKRVHGLSCADYRSMFSIPASYGLASRSARLKAAEVTRARHISGDLTPDLKTATDKARGAGRGHRVGWELEEQSSRAAQIPHVTLAPGTRRADGRDADVAREAQRRRRAAKGQMV